MHEPLMPHQERGVKFLLSGPKDHGLFDEQGVAKSRQVIEAVCRLKGPRLVVVVTKQGVRSTWDADDDGQIALWSRGHNHVMRYDRKGEKHLNYFVNHSCGPNEIMWVVTNYEYLRPKIRARHIAETLRAFKGETIFIVDESSMVKGHTADQTKACRTIASEAGRTWLMTGTAIANNLMDLWSQLTIMDPASCHHLSWWEFRNVYAIMGGFEMKQVVGYRENEVQQLKKHLKRWVIRREKKEVFPDLPAKSYTTRECVLSAETWKAYTEMRDEMIVWMDDKPASVASHGAIKALRLGQLTGGYLGSTDEFGESQVRELGDEKLSAFLDWLDGIPPDRRVILWCRFTAELKRAGYRIGMSGRPVFYVHGGQTVAARDSDLKSFKDTPGSVLVGQPQAGGWGLNLQVCDTMAYLSNDYNLVTRLQSEDRVHRLGQKNAVTYVDFLATSPTGNKTIDHHVVRALKRKEDLAHWTYDQWRDAVKGD